ncbi:MAG: gliding motility-associated C-terminal domain-containing protein [Saprospiraceae bacterium]|nr:gliding motility-associated C-terminal domain-containing protein [Saprospiraceae bacterium]
MAALKRIFYTLIILGIFSLLNSTYSQIREICDNALDDDGDGLIDINDTTDCKCLGIKDSIFVPSSLIPNPSFELYTQCPDALMQMNRATGWIQASPATSDYFNLCGFKDDPFRGTPPQPLPAGKGYVGFLDIRNFPQRGIYKEYIGACLTSTMSAGKEYTLTFWVGFGRKGQLWGPRSVLNMAIFATSKCSNLPFAINPPGYQCPTRYPGWFELSRITVSGTNQWKKVVIKLRPTVNVEAIALGPACAATDGEYYFWMDELLLEETVKFDSLKVDVSGNFCTDSIQLKSSKNAQVVINYQWYKNGIAIQGADQSSFNIPKGDTGKYNLRVSYKNQCEYSKIFDYKIDQFVTEFKPDICEGDSVRIANKFYFKAGLYQDTLKTKNGCDSILQIELHEFKKYISELNYSICEGDSLSFDGIALKNSGIFPFNYFTQNACDSTININLKVVRRDTTNLKFTICPNDSIEINRKYYNSAGTYSVVLKNQFNCDSLVAIDIVENLESSSHLEKTICQGDYVAIGKKKYTQTGIFTDTLTNVFSCDSIVTLDLKVNPVDSIVLDSSICDGSFVEVSNQKFDKSGLYIVKGLNQFSCDSIIVLTLTVNSNNNSAINREICEGEIFQVGDVLFFKTGTYDVHVENQYNCDSLITLNLIVNPAKTTRIDTSICFGKEIILNDEVFNKTGTYVIKEKTTKGCDSVVTLQLKVPDALKINDTIIGLKCFEHSDAEIKIGLSGGVPPFSARWHTGDTVFNLKNIGGGVYRIQVIDSLGCEIEKEIEIVRPPCFCFSINTVNGDCQSFAGGSLFIEQLAGGRPVNYLLNGKSVVPNRNVINSLSVGEYKLTILDSNGCTFYSDFNISFDSSYINDLGADTIYSTVGDTIILMVPANNGINPIQHLWEGNGNILCNNCELTKTIAKDGSNLYSYSGKDKNGCEIIYSLIVEAKQGFWTPNVFSPNGDGINDYFNLISDSSIGVIDRLQIFSRWGELIFESQGGIPNSPSGAWNGTLRDNSVNPGVYVFVFQFSDKTGKSFTLSGDVTVMH